MDPKESQTASIRTLLALLLIRVLSDINTALHDVSGLWFGHILTFVCQVKQGTNQVGLLDTEQYAAPQRCQAAS